MSKAQRVHALLQRPIMWPCPKTAVEMIANEEDCRLRAYLDTTGTPTCGWGETDGVRLGDVWTQEFADQRLLQSLTEWTQTVLRYIGEAPTTENQLSALLSLSYNIGLAGFKRSTVLKCHRRGDYAAAARAFDMWNKSTRGGVKSDDPVLTARRKRESALYLTPDDEQDAPKAVQGVAEESKLSASPIMVGGAVSMGTGVVSMIKPMLDQFAGAASKAQEVAGSLQVSPVMVLAIVALAVGATSMYWRWKQREGGWA